MGCLDKGCAALAIAVIAIAAAVLSDAYWKDTILHGIYGPAYHLRQAVPVHGNRTVFLRYEEVAARVAAIPAEAESGDVVHPPMLAQLELSPLAFAGLSEIPSISIATTPAQHAALRPFIASRLSAQRKFWAAEDLLASAAAFIQASGPTLDVGLASCAQQPSSASHTAVPLTTSFPVLRSRVAQITEWLNVFCCLRCMG